MCFHCYCCGKHNICTFGGLEQASVPWERQMENRPNSSQRKGWKREILMFIHQEFLKPPQDWGALLWDLYSNASSSGKLSLVAHPKFLGRQFPLPPLSQPLSYFTHDCEDYLTVSFHCTEGCREWCLAHGGRLINVLHNACVAHDLRIFSRATEDKKSKQGRLNSWEVRGIDSKQVSRLRNTSKSHRMCSVPRMSNK